MLLQVTSFKHGFWKKGVPCKNTWLVWLNPWFLIWHFQGPAYNTNAAWGMADSLKLFINPTLRTIQFYRLSSYRTNCIRMQGSKANDSKNIFHNFFFFFLNSFYLFLSTVIYGWFKKCLKKNKNAPLKIKHYCRWIKTVFKTRL